MSPTKIMIIDDDAMFPNLFRYMWSKTVEDAAFEIFRDTADALDKLSTVETEAEHPQIILLDLYRLGRDGKEFLKKYGEIFGDKAPSKIYTITASPFPCDIDLKQKHPFVYGSFTKPITHIHIDQMVQNNLCLI